MKKKYGSFVSRGVSTLLIFFLVFGVMVGTEVRAEGDAISRAVEYLHSQSDSAGKTMALAAAGENTDVSYLKTFNGESAISYAKPILALTSVGKDPRTYPNENFVVKIKSFETNGQIGDPGTLNDDFWGILALSSAGVPVSDSLLEGSKQFILNNQNSDGGWSWGVGSGSDTDNTAAAVMALLEMGISSGNETIQEAIDYIKGNQNEDGGFASDPSQSWGTDSNTATTAWVVAMINKLGEDPHSWVKNENNPLDFMLTLQDEDGGFWWVESGDNKTSTADVVVSLTGKTFPVGKISAGSLMAALRIEGSESQVCGTTLEAQTALDIVVEGSTVCGYTYEIIDTGFGPYLKSVNNDIAEGMNGWMYFVNWISPNVGAGDYQLNEGDSVLWYFGEWGWEPLRITLDAEDSYSEGDVLTGKVESVRDGNWSPVPEAGIKFNGETYSSASDGTFSIELSSSGVFEMVAEKENYVRSDKILVTVGSTSGSVSLSVLISEEDIEPEPEIGFKLSESSLSFGELTPGQNATKNLGIENTGLKNINLDAEVDGDQVFHLLKLDGLIWSLFETFLPTNSQKTLSLLLEIPSGFSSFGEKAGELVIWGSEAE